MRSDGRRGTATLVRHAETAWSLSGRHTGRTDVPLTDRGREIACSLADKLRGRSFDRVLTSPLSRAVETATLAGFANAEPDRDLMEWDYGNDEGLTTPQIREQRAGWLLWRDGAARGEVADEVGARADRVIAKITARDEDVLIFAHGHVLRVLAARWLQQPADFGARLALGTGTLSMLGYEHDVRAVLRWNAD